MAGIVVQVVLFVKSVTEAGGVPTTMVALVKAMTAPVLLVRVTACAPAGVPIAVEVKESEVGEMASGANGVRFRDATKASEGPSRAVWNAPRLVGKSVEKVCPVTKTMGKVPKAMPKAWSGLPWTPVPPK